MNRDFPRNVNISVKQPENSKSSVLRGMHGSETFRSCGTQLLFLKSDKEPSPLQNESPPKRQKNNMRTGKPLSVDSKLLRFLEDKFFRGSRVRW